MPTRMRPEGVVGFLAMKIFLVMPAKAGIQ
jgi:hypothetical protein